MDFLFSIHPEYAKKIYNKTKEYEYRKRLPNHFYIGDKIYLYETSPIKKVTGYFFVDDYYSTNGLLLWNKTKDKSGISFESFSDYFYDDNPSPIVKKKRLCYAIKIKSPIKFDIPLTIKDFNNEFYIGGKGTSTKAPQSFCYIHSKKI